MKASEKTEKRMFSKLPLGLYYELREFLDPVEYYQSLTTTKSMFYGIPGRSESMGKSFSRKALKPFFQKSRILASVSATRAKGT
jgi:hypothetical protein